MRKLLITLLSTTALVLCLGAVQAQAGCQAIHLQNKAGGFDGTVCVDGTTITLDGKAVVVATGKTYTVDADATVSGTPGHYTVSGTVTISDGTNTKTITFTCPGPTTVTAATAFTSRSINWVLSQTPPPPAAFVAAAAASAD